MNWNHKMYSPHFLPPRLRASASSFLALLLLALSACLSLPAAAEVLPGVEVLARDHAADLRGKRVGILTNPTGVTRRMVSTIDVVRALPNVEVVRLFAPEHGLRGGFQAGENIDKQQRDPVSGLPVVSLHGASRRPSPESVAGLDIVIYDIQDVGVRHYTFISSLANMMETCAAAGVEVWVLDRPCPLGGDKLGGPLLQPEQRSFIGIHTLPVVYGLTPGEFARLYQRECTPNLTLRVIPLAGWRRGMVYGDLGWLWVPPSEHIPRWQSCFYYAMLGTIGELGIVSEGVGTPLPFEQTGAPWVDAAVLARELNAAGLAGVVFTPTTFRPRYGTHAGEFCGGVQAHLLDPRAFEPGPAGEALLTTYARLFPGRIFTPGDGNRYQMFLKGLGDRAAAQALHEQQFDALRARIAAGLKDYEPRRAAVLLYP